MPRLTRCPFPADALRMLEKYGSLIGYGQCDHPYYVMDGKVWLISSVTQVAGAGDYYEFMQWAREHPEEFRSAKE